MTAKTWEKPEVDSTRLTRIKRDDVSHIAVKDMGTCKKCSEKPCTYICPTQVYNWTDNGLDIDYDRCVECGACIFAYQCDNISWNFPRAGFGISYHY